MTSLPYRSPDQSEPPKARLGHVDLWAMAALFLSLVGLAAGFYLMIRNDSSPMFLLPATISGVIAIINLRE